jgi:pilus assembly protein Flp/PilA
MVRTRTRANRRWGRQGGQGIVEYALILVLVAVVVIVILLTMGNQIANVFSNVVAALGLGCNPGPGGGHC